MVLARRLHVELNYIFLIYHPTISPPTCSVVYLSIIFDPANIVPLSHSIASVAWQVYLRSLQCILPGLLASLIIFKLLLSN